LVFETIKNIIAKHLEIDPATITMETDFMNDLGADSLDLMELIMTVEETLNVTVTDDSVGKATTVGDVVAIIEKLM